MAYRECRAAKLAREVYAYVLESTETFRGEDNIGSDLAYLMGAILMNIRCEWSIDAPIVLLLQGAPESEPARKALKYIDTREG